MAELPEIRLGSQLIYEIAVGQYSMGWNDLSSSIAPIGPISPAVQNFVTASGITNSTQISAVNTLYNDLSSSALLDKMYALYPIVGGNATAHSYNLISTASYQINWNGTITHNSAGFTGDGSTGYGDTTLNAGNISGWTESGSFGMYSSTIGVDDYDMGCSNTSAGPDRQTALIIKFRPNDVFYAGMPVGGTGTTYSGAEVTGAGLYTVSRTTGTVLGSINGSIYITGTPSTYYPPNRGGIVLAAFREANNTIVGHSARTYSFAFIGKGLTSSDHANLYTAVQTYQTTLNREV